MKQVQGICLIGLGGPASRPLRCPDLNPLGLFLDYLHNTEVLNRDELREYIMKKVFFSQFDKTGIHGPKLHFEKWVLKYI